jgi:hypothetical protein
VQGYAFYNIPNIESASLIPKVVLGLRSYEEFEVQTYNSHLPLELGFVGMSNKL